MGSNPDSPERWLRAVVRGELPMSGLEEIGVSMQIQESDVRRERRIKINLRTPSSVSLQPVDLALGLLKYRYNPAKLQEWATFIMCAESIDLTFLESWPEGEELLEAVWDASFEGRVKQSVIRIASALADG